MRSENLVSLLTFESERKDGSGDENLSFRLPEGKVTQ